MTAKEKASEMIAEFTRQCEYNCQPSTVDGIAKENALYMVNDIIKEYHKLNEKFSIDFNPTLKYYYEVKFYINKFND